MMRAIALTLALLPTAVMAQAMATPGSLYSGGSTLDDYGITPTMKREKLERAIALRDEAAALLAADGGTFTAEHQAYVRRKAHAILTLGQPRAYRTGGNSR